MAMSGLIMSPPVGDRIRWGNDEEAARASRALPLNRVGTSGSLSIHTIPSRRNSIDPSAALPIQYRTLYALVALLVC
jgi:hypothetical protein